MEHLLKLKNKKQIEWVACAAWQIKLLIDNGKCKNFSNQDYKLIKIINKTYNKAHKENSFWLYMIGDEFADKLSKQGFIKLKKLCSQFDYLNYSGYSILNKIC